MPFYAGLAKRGAGTPHRPAALYAYMQHDPFEPSFVVDVTDSWAAEEAALDAYESQLFRPGEGADASSASPGPPTKVGSRELRLAVEGRARLFGQMINAELGEPFWSRVPLAVSDPWQLLPGGLR